MESILPHRTLLKPALLTWEDDGHLELLVQLTAPGPRRPPRIVVAALDASQAPFEPARRALVALGDDLAADDLLGLVGVSREAVLLRPAVPVGSGDDVGARLLDVERGAFANLSAGLVRAIGEARRARERAWRTAWEHAHAVGPRHELRGVLERLGPCDADRPADPTTAFSVLHCGWDLATPQIRLLEAGAFADVVLVADGDPGRGETEPEVFAGIAARAHRHGVRINTVGTSTAEDWDERLELIASAGGGRHRCCADPATLEHDVHVAGGGDAEPIAAQAVTARVRLSGGVGEVETGGRLQGRIDLVDELLLDLGDLRCGERRQLGLRIALDGSGRRRRGRAARRHRTPVSVPAADGSVAPVTPLAHLELEWLVAEDGAAERVVLPVHRGVEALDVERLEQPRAWHESLPEADWTAADLAADREAAEDALMDDVAGDERRRQDANLRALGLLDDTAQDQLRLSDGPDAR